MINGQFLSDLICHQLFVTVDHALILETLPLPGFQNIILVYRECFNNIQKIILHFLLTWLAAYSQSPLLLPFYAPLPLRTEYDAPNHGSSVLFCFVSPILDLLVISGSSMVWKATYMLRMPTFTFLALDTPLHSRQLLTSSIWMCHSLN